MALTSVICSFSACPFDKVRYAGIGRENYNRGELSISNREHYRNNGCENTEGEGKWLTGPAEVPAEEHAADDCNDCEEYPNDEFETRGTPHDTAIDSVLGYITIGS
jgi:hypothetical protein